MAGILVENACSANGATVNVNKQGDCSMSNMNNVDDAFSLVLKN